MVVEHILSLSEGLKSHGILTINNETSVVVSSVLVHEIAKIVELGLLM